MEIESFLGLDSNRRTSDFEENQFEIAIFEFFSPWVSGSPKSIDRSLLIRLIADF